MTTERCNDCRYYDPGSSTCRRHAPVPVRQGMFMSRSYNDPVTGNYVTVYDRTGDTILTVFPSMNGYSDWCGEWKALATAQTTRPLPLRALDVTAQEATRGAD